MLLYTFLIHISSVSFLVYLCSSSSSYSTSSYFSTFSSSTYVMYILLLSIKTDNKQVEWKSIGSSSASISKMFSFLFIMCYVHILNHKWTSMYKSLCLLPRQLFGCFTIRLSWMYTFTEVGVAFFTLIYTAKENKVKKEGKKIWKMSRCAEKNMNSDFIQLQNVTVVGWEYLKKIIVW